MTAQGNQSSGDSSGFSRLTVQQVSTVPAHDEGVGQGLVLGTDRGDLRGILHKAEGSRKAVVWVCGARGGFGGPGPGTYVRLAEAFRDQGVSSLRLDYRQPNDMRECVLDLVAGIAFLKDAEYDPVVVVGHSFGGAVVIAAAVASDHVKGVVSLSPQTFGTTMVRQLVAYPIVAGAWQSRHSPALFLRSANLPDGQGAERIGALRRSRAPLGGMPGGVGDTVRGLDSGDSGGAVARLTDTEPGFRCHTCGQVLPPY